MALPFKADAFEKVYSAHTIEHFSHKETENVLREWARVLTIEGVMEIRCRWLRIRALLFFLFPTKQNVINIYGGQEYSGNYHKTGFSFGLLRYYLRAVGLKHINRVIEKKWIFPYVSDLHVIAKK